ncbi:heparanase-like protein 1 [Cucurbita maxima]|uniref:Heparanase-like protein 1 n=1 Tax=Cucurbita maxima TaxID=3661 RepID=A0A6J1HPK0_CUCMA|nr:heparanase-like protein 1 [Cucurbita maxima]
MENKIVLIFVLAFIPTILGRNATTGTIVVDATTTIAETDENFVCFTLDIWPHDECRWSKLCVWDGHASMLNLDLTLPIMNKAVQAFKSVRIRVGGTLQDKLIYNVGAGFQGTCHPFQATKGSLFDFSVGCLYMERWDDLNNFFNNTGAIVTFGLNALLGKYKTQGIQWEGNWNYSNAEALIQYTVENNYQINSWEFGNPHISYTFINSFWYLDQLGMASMYNTKVYCRQTLIGGFYGVIKSSTLLPTPDYYGALLFHRLMGPRVLKIDNNVSSDLRSYAHCSRGRSGVTLLFINLSNATDFIIDLENNINLSSGKRNASKGQRVKIDSPREEYHLTPKDGLVRSSTVLLNGNPLETTKEGDIPNLIPVYRQSNSSIHIAGWSIAFIVVPHFVAPACN